MSKLEPKDYASWLRQNYPSMIGHVDNLTKNIRSSLIEVSKTIGSQSEFEQEVDKIVKANMLSLLFTYSKKFHMEEPVNTNQERTTDIFINTAPQEQSKSTPK